MKEIYIDENDIPQNMETCNIEFEPFGAGYSNIQFKSLQEHDKEKDRIISNLKGLLLEKDKQIKNLKTNKKRVIEHKNKIIAELRGEL